VTPVLNGEKFLDQTILSVVSQAGPFTIRYHVQDGGSKDRTMEILAAWKCRLARDFPVFCEGIEFSFASEPDVGLYDAVNRGFAACGDSNVMAWINADDRYDLGAFVTVAEVFSSCPDIDWLTGRPTVIAESGATSYLSPIIPFPQSAIAAGIFEGRFARPFIQQEGTFWRPELWEKTGGVDPNFRLAGDFDLWRRFAKQTDLVIVDAVLGCFRVRAGQLSTDMAGYHAEIDASFSPAEIETRAKTSKSYAKAMFDYRVLACYYGGPWRCERRPMCTEQAEALAEALGGAKSPWAATKADLTTAKSELKTEIAELRTELKTEIAELRTELKTEIAETRTDLLKWIIGAIGFQTVVILGALISLVRILAK
jgi:glycosyltransferase involved in cell wall biosynthesis